MVQRLALLVAYDGTPYRGWNDVRDSTLRPTLARILRHDPLLDAASRTDAGVHALGQVRFTHAVLRRPHSLLQVSVSSHSFTLRGGLHVGLCVRHGI